MQAVENEADTGHDAGDEAGNDTDDLDALLSSFSQEDEEDNGRRQNTETNRKDRDVNDNEEMPAWAKKILDDNKQLRSEISLGEQRKDVANAISVLKSSNKVLSDRSDDWIKRQLHGQALNDFRFETAFARRRVDPKSWNSVLKAFGKELAKEIDGFRSSATDEDVDAVTAAARNVSTKRSGDPDFAKKVNNMSPADFEKFAAEMARKGS